MASQLNDHIHLSTTIQATGEKAPDLKWKVRMPGHHEIPAVFMALRRTTSGALKRHSLTSGGNIVQLVNFKLTIKVQADYTYTTVERKAQLEALQGKQAYFCDNYHAADGADHTADIRTVVVSKVGDFVAEDSLLQHYYVDVELEDASL
jgi:hypothetical protein